MTTDVTSLTSNTRVQSNSTNNYRAFNNVVPITNVAATQSVKQPQKVEIADVERATSKVNDFVKQIDRNLEFAVDESSGRVIITVREPETGKIIRQIPPEELLVIAKLVSENFSSSVPSGILLADEG